MPFIMNERDLETFVQKMAMKLEQAWA